MLPALVASAVIAIVILARRPLLYVWSGLAGIVGGTILRLTPGGDLIARQAEDWTNWFGQPVLGLVFGLSLAVIFDLLLQPGVPILGRIRPVGRRALQPWNWGTSAEIAERAGVASWMPAMLGLSVEYRPLTAAQIMMRIRATAAVLCGSCLAVFFTIEAFRTVLFETLTAFGPMLVSAIAALFVTALLGPLQDEILRADDDSSGDAPQKRSTSLMSNAGVFAVSGILFVLLEAVQTAIESQVQTLSVYHWILLLELGGLPLVVTSFFFGATLHRVELGSWRWDRALQASIFAGAIFVSPFTMLYFLMDSFPPSSWGGLANAFAESDHASRVLIFLLIGVLFAICLGIVAAAVISTLTYGIYAVALALALSDSPRSKVRWRAVVSIIVAGAVVQGLIAGVLWWFDAEQPSLGYVPFAMAVGWAAGLFASRFHTDFPEPQKPVEPAVAA